MGGTPEGRSWYQLLGVEDFAAADEIRSAYLRLARSLHPDLQIEASPAEQRITERRMREVNAAWAVLGNEESRRVYDTGLRMRESYRSTF